MATLNKRADSPRALALGAAEKKRYAEKGRKAIARVQALKHATEKAFYEMGTELAILKDEYVLRSLGYQTFPALCNVALGMSHDQANRLIDVAANFDVAVAAKLTLTKAAAIIQLARAFGKKTTPGGIVQRGVVKLPSGRAIDIRGSSAASIYAAAREIRSQAPSKGPQRGVRVSKTDADVIKAMAHAMKSLNGAALRAIAGPKTKGAKVQITVNLSDVKALAHLLISTVKGR